MQTPSEMRCYYTEKYGGLTTTLSDAITRLEKYQAKYNSGQSVSPGETNDFSKTRGELALHESLMSAGSGYAWAVRLVEERAQKARPIQARPAETSLDEAVRGAMEANRRRGL